MIRQLMSAIRTDDNPRLHRIPFVLLWMLSFVLAWYAILIYEGLWYIKPLCDVVYLVKYGDFPEGLFIGLLFGLVLAFVQTWLLRQRYGFVLKYWGLITIIGATIAGLGYPRVGTSVFTRPTLGDDFILWFSVLGFFQAVAMMPINRKGWLIFIVGIFCEYGYGCS